MKKYESQQARRILDRLVGYQISPVLWTKVKRGLSAGRVQSVAVRLVVEREAEIKAFVPEEYWTVEADGRGRRPAAVHGQGGQARRQEGRDDQRGRGARGRSTCVQGAASCGSRRSSARSGARTPPPPFITSKLQQEASSKLRFSPKRTMGLAQRLYEGVELGEEGPVGLITYMRTDSTRVSDDAMAEVRAYIGETLRRAIACRPSPIVYKTKKSAQDAHEAIRPTSMKYDPETVRALWATGKGGGRDEREIEDLLKLYTLIWNRFVGLPDDRRRCSTRPAIDIDAGRVGLRATGQVMKFAGFLEVYAETVEDAASTRTRAPAALPDVKEGEVLTLRRGQARAALHPAAAALLRGDAGQGAGREGHRPPVDLRGHPVDHPGPRLRREEGRRACTRPSWG